MNTATNDLTKAIVATVARFDIFDYPLTDFEIWQFLPISAAYADVRRVLADQLILESKHCFYFLPGRRNIVAIRQSRYRDAEIKIKTARRLIRYITWLPSIRFIGLANIIGSHNLKREADLDLFIVTKKDRLWLSKFIASAILALLRLRPTSAIAKDRLCLSFLVDDSALDLSSGLYNQNDWYFAFWLAGLMPLFGSIQVYEALIKSNSWLNDMLPNWQLINNPMYQRFTGQIRTSHTYSLGIVLENISKKMHTVLMSRGLKSRQNKDTSVIITDHMLKLHTLDRRPIFFQQAEEKTNLYI